MSLRILADWVRFAELNNLTHEQLTKDIFSAALSIAYSHLKDREEGTKITYRDDGLKLTIEVISRNENEI